jgi:DNA-binding NarL/FixJ family response regulator
MASMPELAFLIVDDHPLVLDALQATVQREFPNAEIATANSIAAALSAIEGARHFDLIVADLRMPDADGYGGLMRIRSAAPKQRLAVVSAIQDPSVIEHARQLGACGFIQKSARREEIVAAVKAMLDGRESFPALVPRAPPAERGPSGDTALMTRVRELTPAQFGVLKLICQGKLNKQIAHELSIGESTVKSHVTSILKKLNVHSRTQAVLVMQQIRLHDVRLDATSYPH